MYKYSLFFKSTSIIYEYQIFFNSTSTHGNADALNLLPLPDSCKNPPVPTETVLLLEKLSKGPFEIKLWTRRDPILSKVFQFILNGWPLVLSTPVLKPYSTRNYNSQSTQDGIVLWDNRVVVTIPGSTTILDELHACHPGMSHMQILFHMFL